MDEDRGRKSANGDTVACATLWKPPNPFDGVTTEDVKVAQKLAQGGAYRADMQSPDWFGYALAEHLHLNVRYQGDNDQRDVAKVKQIINTWIKNKVLQIDKRADANRKEKRFIVPVRATPTGSANGFPDDDEFTMQ
jgi:hypothetical protein